MKHFLFFTCITFLCFGCEKNEISPIGDIEYEPVTWKLDALTFGDPAFPTTALNSDRTLRFWNGSVQSNGSFCDFREDAGQLQAADYDAERQSIFSAPCLTDTDTLFAGVWAYTIDELSDYLFVYQPRDSFRIYRFTLVEE